MVLLLVELLLPFLNQIPDTTHGGRRIVIPCFSLLSLLLASPSRSLHGGTRYSFLVVCSLLLSRMNCPPFLNVVLYTSSRFALFWMSSVFGAVSQSDFVFTVLLGLTFFPVHAVCLSFLLPRIHRGIQIHRYEGQLERVRQSF